MEALEAGLHEIALCPFRIALLHYAPIADTLEGEPREIWTFLGQRPPGRARSSSTAPTSSCTATRTPARLEGELDGVPVYNVSVPVMGQDFWLFELSGAAQAATAIH